MTSKLLLFILVLAATSYLPRVLPLSIFRRRIRSPFIQSFLVYMPYAILAAMIFPDVLTSTGSIYSAAAGALVALVMAYHRKGLLPVALAATATVFLVEQLLHFITIA